MNTWRATRALFLAVAIGVVAAAESGCGNFEPPAKPVSNWTVPEARQFDEFDVYWLGQRYKELSLTYIGRSTDGDGVEHVTFAYGEPSYFGDAASGSWHSPLEIDIQPYCGYSPEEVQSQPRYLDPDISTPQVRGVSAYLARYDYDWNYLTLWSGNSAIYISEHKAGFDIEHAAMDLIPIAKEAGATLETLPPPVETSC